MPTVAKRLRHDGEVGEFDMVLSDLYPNEIAAERLNLEAEGIRYEEEPVNAADVPGDLKGVRTLICSLHYMRPDTAREILGDARSSGQPLVAFEISDNSAPFILWWTAIPVGFLMTLYERGSGNLARGAAIRRVLLGDWNQEAGARAVEDDLSAGPASGQGKFGVR